MKTHLEECTTRYLGFKCFLFSVYRVYPEVEDGRGTLDFACAFGEFVKEFHRRDFANRTGLAQAWTVKSADRLFTW